VAPYHDQDALNLLFHVKHDPAALRDLRGAAARLGVDVSTSALEKLARFEALLVERAIPLGLVAEADAGRIRERHVLDSMRALAAVSRADRAALDLGSGAGLPGIVVAAASPDLAVRLVEPRRARVAFLELAVERLGLTNASVLPVRIEDVLEEADLCFARAFAPLPRAWAAARLHLRPGGRLVYFAGSGATTPAPLDGASAVDVRNSPLLESSGPLIIMTR
jgi:16S rRNA (guanine527-N7)-methyltransferase